MADPHRTYEIRCPVHTFVTLNDWEREIIEQPAFQRLRRIRQLAWTDQVYPGAMHTRFEHSLGVMHVATQLYDALVERSGELLRSELAYTKGGLERDRSLVRLAALLHDVGHGPFSHAAEELLPDKPDGTGKYRHEDYSAAIIRTQFREAIEKYPLNENCGFRAEDVANLLEGKIEAGRNLIWKELISGQLDADRIDYLLRDSLHAGVEYGRFDWRRLLHTVELTMEEEPLPQVGVSEGGWHVAEALFLARYFMFTQVYFHKTRVAFNYHLRQTLGELLPGGRFPQPEGAELKEFLRWDDWRVQGLLAEGQGGEHGRRLAQRDHFREVYHTPERPTRKDQAELRRVRETLGSLIQTEQVASASWYNIKQDSDIRVISDNPGRPVSSLSAVSSMVGLLKPIKKIMLYARREDTPAIRTTLERLSRTPR